MAISDFISTSFLFSIAIIVILIGGIFAYVSYRMAEQDHKVSSMLGLVSTMADEIHQLKNKIDVPVNQHHHQQNEIYNYEDDEEVGLKKHSLGGNPKLIHVSDDEETSSEYDDDESESEEEDDESESDTEDDETDADTEDAESEADADETEIFDLENNKNIILDNDINILDLEDMSNEITEESDETNTELMIDLVDVNETTDVAINDIKSIHLAEPINMHLDELTAVDINNDLKTISISMTDIGMNINDFGDESNKHKSVDYKKMSLIKLRDVVVEKGIIPDASKLKKNELLKLLGEE